ncbi:CpaF family protein [Paenibacillus senegalensis]|uniref:CpaF family protein n=1 Tax=Paenibacillus senegalensis TaxID=1465766 RepID=UPI000287AAFA|nr:CpaF family protein [Paenibacillus senegalensis]
MVEEEIIQEIRQEVANQLDYSETLSDQALEELIEQQLFTHTRAAGWTAARKAYSVKRIYHSFRGLDVLQPLLEDPGITEIMINSHNEVFIEREGLIRSCPVAFEHNQKLEDIIQSIVSKVNRVVNEASPIVDARLSDGSRVNVVLPPIALKGPTMTIRKFPAKPLGMEDLVKKQALSEEAARFLEQAVRAKYNMFIGGGTGSGKTTFLNALSGFIPANERIITIEDSAELQIYTIPNLVSLETRNANTEGKGEINMKQLIRTSLRMRPNRIIVGEVRGEEALDMLSAMNTGHDGSLSTGHANSSYDMLSRLETMVLSAAEMPIEVVRKQIASAIDIMIHLTRMRDGSRKVSEISEVLGVENGEIMLNPLFVFEEAGDGRSVKVAGRLQRTGNSLVHRQKFQLAGISVEGGLC